MKRHLHNKPDTRIKARIDPKLMPGTKHSAEERWANSTALPNTPGQQYVEGRRIPIALAQEAGVRYDRDWNGRPAVLVAMRGLQDELCSVHGRYLQRSGDPDKMLTIGPGGGILNIGDALKGELIILVEGLFDALTLALCGYPALATVGRVAPWLPLACKEKTVVLAFDGNKPGDANALFYKEFLDQSHVHRLNPPGHSKDWNSALLKQGKATVEQWLRINIARLTNTKTLAS